MNKLFQNGFLFFLLFLVISSYQGFSNIKLGSSETSDSFGGNAKGDTIQNKKRVYTTIKINNPTEIDGKLNDKCRKVCVRA